MRDIYKNVLYVLSLCFLCILGTFSYYLYQDNITKNMDHYTILQKLEEQENNKIENIVKKEQENIEEYDSYGNFKKETKINKTIPSDNDYNFIVNSSIGYLRDKNFIGLNKYLEEYSINYDITKNKKIKTLITDSYFLNNFNQITADNPGYLIEKLTIPEYIGYVYLQQNYDIQYKIIKNKNSILTPSYSSNLELLEKKELDNNSYGSTSYFTDLTDLKVYSLKYLLNGEKFTMIICCNFNTGYVLKVFQEEKEKTLNTTFEVWKNNK